MSLLNVLAEDRKLISYRPSLRTLCGSVNAVILFQQILYWHDKMNGKFFKFLSPCSHDWYKDGDSFEEEIGMSAKEIKTALDSIAFKCGGKNKALHGDKYETVRDNAMILYYTDAYRVTWYTVNEHIVTDRLAFTYNCPTGVYKKPNQPEFTNTETTTENTTKNNTYTATEGQGNENVELNVDAVGLMAARRKGDNVDNDSFETAWAAYGRKGTKEAALRYWKKIPQADREAITKAIPLYLKTVSERMFQKNFEGWINPANRMWDQDWAALVPNKQAPTQVVGRTMKGW